MSCKYERELTTEEFKERWDQHVKDAYFFLGSIIFLWGSLTIIWYIQNH